MLLNNVHHISHELILERYCFVLGWITLSDIDVKEAGALPWSPELGRDKLLEIEYFISFSRILRHNVHFGHTGELCSLNPHNKLNTYDKQNTLSIIDKIKLMTMVDITLISLFKEKRNNTQIYPKPICHEYKESRAF